MRTTPEQHARLLADVERDAGAHMNDACPPALKALKRLIPHGARAPLRAVLTAAVRPYARRKAKQRVRASSPLRLNLGSGFAPIEGWTNIDLVGAPVDVPWNLKHGVPFPDGSAHAVFSEHVFEHFTVAAGLALARDAARVLGPGGVFRVAVPDAGALLRSYAGTDDEEWALSRSTRMQAVVALFYGHGHRTMYDAELLTALCEVAGFDAVEVRDFRESRLGDGVPDSEHRREHTLYVEGIKPARGPVPPGRSRTRTGSRQGPS